MQANGFSPYRYPPNVSELSRLDGVVWAHVNRKVDVTIYPPIAGSVLALLVAGRFRQRALVSGDDGAWERCWPAGLLVGLLRDLGRSPARRDLPVGAAADL